MSPSKKILFKLTGSIACYKACNLISTWVQQGHEVQTVASQAALKFIGASTLEGLTGKPVFHDLYEPGKQMAHINLAKWADLTVLCPTTANTINKLSQGVGDDLLSSLFLAHDFKKPYFIAPAMNTAMYWHPATQDSLKKLQAWGVKLLPTGEGRLACGDVGEGKLLDPEMIAQKVEESWAKPEPVNTHRLNILISAGGTEEPIDGVRSISNFSSGSTGAYLADYLTEFGHTVTLLRSQRAKKATQVVKERTFRTFTDLDSLMQEQLSSEYYDSVIHLAAVSDYSVAELTLDGDKQTPQVDSKLKSGKEMSLQLTRNPKIIDQLISYSKNPEITLVAFKLTHNATQMEGEEAVARLFDHSHAAIVVHNDLSEVNAEQGLHRARIYEAKQFSKEVSNKRELAEGLEQLIRESITV